MLIYLVGFMASGKSTAGKILAELLDIPFIDTDRAVEAISGHTVSDIFMRSGEEYFRELEMEVLHKLPGTAVVATGGGLPAVPGAMDYMNDTGITCYLKLGIRDLVYRLRKERGQRPLLTAPDESLELQVAEMLEWRKRFYEMALIVTDGTAGAELVSRDILRQVNYIR